MFQKATQYFFYKVSVGIVKRYLHELRQVGLHEGHYREGSASSRQNPVNVDNVGMVRSQAQCLHLSVDVLVLKKQERQVSASEPKQGRGRGRRQKEKGHL